MFTREGVTEEKWYKDQVRLYGLLYEMSKSALEELDLISKTNGSESIRLSTEERSRRAYTLREIRKIFAKLDPKFTKVDRT